MEVRNVQKQLQWKRRLCFFHTSNLRHLKHSGGKKKKKKKVLLLYFQQACTVQSHSHFQSPRLNPLTGEGVCLRIALTAGACLSVLAMPSKGVLADLHSGFLLKKNKKKTGLHSQSLHHPSNHLLTYSSWMQVFFCWRRLLNVEYAQSCTEVSKA